MDCKFTDFRPNMPRKVKERQGKRIVRAKKLAKTINHTIKFSKFAHNYPARNPMKKLYFLLLAFFVISGSCLAQYRKAVSILGDSYSTYEGFIPSENMSWYFNNPQQNNDVNAVTLTWWHKFITENGYRLCVNNSYSGATICNTGYDKEDYSDRSFITRMDNLGCPDIIFIFGGTNDSWADSPIGEYLYSGWTKDDLYSFRPAMSYMLDHITKRYPNVGIYCLLNTGLKKEIEESIKTICRHYEVNCIELENIDKIAGHPSIKGMDQINEQIKAYMREK